MRGEKRCTDAALAVALVDAEHGDVTPETPFTVWRLLADYDPDGMRDALRVSLEMEIVSDSAGRERHIAARTRKERWGLTKKKRTGRGG
jgi:hypothetical protein